MMTMHLKKDRRDIRAKERKNWWTSLKSQKVLTVLAIAIMIYVIIFRYLPVLGWVMAFQNFKPAQGFGGSEWVGLENFKELLVNNPEFYRSLRNTFAISFLKLFCGFFFSIITALAINEVRITWFKKTTQTISYLPHFVSWVVAATLVSSMLAIDGPVNALLMRLGAVDKEVLFMGKPNFFWLIVALAESWKETGWNAIIYLAAMTSISPALYEAAKIDGAGRLKRIWHITLPGIMPTISILIILNVGQMLNTGYEQILLLQTPLTQEVAEVLDLYVLRFGIQMFNFSFATAAGIFKTVVSVILLLIANKAVHRLGGERVL